MFIVVFTVIGSHQELENFNTMRELQNKAEISDIERKNFEMGEKVYVVFGGFKSAEIFKKLNGGLYEVKIIRDCPVPYSKETKEETIFINHGWWEIFKLSDENCDIKIADHLNLTYRQTDISELINTYYIKFGIEMSPSYQRDYVWDSLDEHKLIDSIFKRVDIGKFALIRRDFGEELLYEMLDGKQRLNTLYRYYTDQFEYLGYCFSKLPFKYKYVFLNTAIVVGVSEKQLSEKQKLEYFLRLNCTGKPQDLNHIKNIEDKLKLLCIEKQ